MKGCGKKHTIYIHIDSDSKSDGTLNVCNTCVSGRMVCFMPIVEVRINGRENALALLDTGSSGTFCTKALTERLGITITGINEMYNLNTLSGSIRNCQNVCSVQNRQGY